MIRKMIFLGFIFFMYIFSLILFPIDISFLTTFNFNVNYSLLKNIFLIVSLFNSISFYKLFLDYDLNNNYLFVLIINYVCTISYNIFFFIFNDLILTIIISTIILTSSILMFLEVKKIDKSNSYLLIPSILFNIYNLLMLFILYLS